MKSYSIIQDTDLAKFEERIQVAADRGANIKSICSAVLKGDKEVSLLALAEFDRTDA